MLKVRFVDASSDQLAKISNGLLKKSKKFTEKAYSKNILTIKNSHFNSKTILDFYTISDFYNKNGKISEINKPLMANLLEDIGLNKNATLGDFMHLILKTYK